MHSDDKNHHCHTHDHDHAHSHEHQHSHGHSHESPSGHSYRHEHEHHHVHTHDHDHTHSHDHNHSHDHDHGDHDHEHPSPASIENDEKTLRVLLVHWINHNRSHQDNFQQWVEKAKLMNRREVAAHIEKAIEYMEMANGMLIEAKKHM